MVGAVSHLTFALSLGLVLGYHARVINAFEAQHGEVIIRQVKGGSFDPGSYSAGEPSNADHNIINAQDGQVVIGPVTGGNFGANSFTISTPTRGIGAKNGKYPFNKQDTTGIQAYAAQHGEVVIGQVKGGSFGRGSFSAGEPGDIGNINPQGNLNINKGNGTLSSNRTKKDNATNVQGAIVTKDKNVKKENDSQSQTSDFVKETQNVIDKPSENQEDNPHAVISVPHDVVPLENDHNITNAQEGQIVIGPVTGGSFGANSFTISTPTRGIGAKNGKYPFNEQDTTGIQAYEAQHGEVVIGQVKGGSFGRGSFSAGEPGDIGNINHQGNLNINKENGTLSSNRTKKDNATNVQGAIVTKDKNVKIENDSQSQTSDFVKETQIVTDKPSENQEDNLHGVISVPHDVVPLGNDHNIINAQDGQIVIGPVTGDSFGANSFTISTPAHGIGAKNGKFPFSEQDITDNRIHPNIEGFSTGDGTSIVIDQISGGFYPDMSFSIGHGNDVINEVELDNSNNGFDYQKPDKQNTPGSVEFQSNEGNKMIEAHNGEVVIGQVKSGSFGRGRFSVGEPGIADNINIQGNQNTQNGIFVSNGPNIENTISNGSITNRQPVILSKDNNITKDKDSQLEIAIKEARNVTNNSSESQQAKYIIKGGGRYNIISAITAEELDGDDSFTIGMPGRGVGGGQGGTYPLKKETEIGSNRRGTNQDGNQPLDFLSNRTTFVIHNENNTNLEEIENLSKDQIPSDTQLQDSTKHEYQNSKRLPKGDNNIPTVTDLPNQTDSEPLFPDNLHNRSDTETEKNPGNLQDPDFESFQQNMPYFAQNQNSTDNNLPTNTFETNEGQEYSPTESEDQNIEQEVSANGFPETEFGWNGLPNSQNQNGPLPNDDWQLPEYQQPQNSFELNQSPSWQTPPILPDASTSAPFDSQHQDPAHNSLYHEGNNGFQPEHNNYPQWQHSYGLNPNNGGQQINTNIGQQNYCPCLRRHSPEQWPNTFQSMNFRPHWPYIPPIQYNGWPLQNRYQNANNLLPWTNNPQMQNIGQPWYHYSQYFYPQNHYPQSYYPSNYFPQTHHRPNYYPQTQYPQNYYPQNHYYTQPYYQRQLPQYGRQPYVLQRQNVARQTRSNIEEKNTL